MKALVVSGFAVETPPRDYGGLEMQAWFRAKALKELGYEVVLVAARGSEPPPGVELVELVEPSFSLDSELRAFEGFVDRIGEFDLVVDESHAKHFARHTKPFQRVLAIFHDFKPPIEELPPHVEVFGVSRFHASWLYLTFGRASHIYNCIDTSLYRPRYRGREPYLLWLNRINKGALLFLRLCQELGAWCIVAGDDDPSHGIDPRYRDAVIKLANRIGADYLGRVDSETKLELLSHATACVGIFEPWYHEVFGIWAVECLASGTPVLALRNGALPEIVPQRYLFDTPLDLLQGLRQRLFTPLTSVEIDACRRWGERFSYEAMRSRLANIISSVER